MTHPNTPPPPAHTAGRLTINEWCCIHDESGEILLLTGVALTTECHRPSQRLARANGRRLVAAWNACVALPTEALERGAVERLVELARLVVRYLETESLMESDDLSDEMGALARAALAPFDGQEETKP